jgi:selenide,water dikinase
MIPFISSAKEYASLYSFPGGAFDNQTYFGEHIQFSKSLTEAEKMLLFDPQTNGGLLFSISRDELDTLRRKAEKVDQPIWVIGEVVKGDKIIIM